MAVVDEASVLMRRCLFLAAGFLTLVLVFGAAQSSGASRRYCDSFRARGYTLYTYVLRGPDGCGEARRVLKAWFVDAGHTQRYGKWWCFDSLGPALATGQIEHCHTSSALIADYGHRL
jgi:hypothetical protein